MKVTKRNTIIGVIAVFICLGSITLYSWKDSLFDINFFSENKGDPTQIKQLEKEVYNYLINVKGYKWWNIKYLNGSYTEFKHVGYSITVIFWDEPNKKYEYQKINGKIRTVSIGKHSER